MAFDADLPFDVPRFKHYDARDLILTYDELFEEDRYQIYAKMTADLEQVYDIEVETHTVRLDFCRLRRFLVDNQKNVSILSHVFAIDVETLRRVIRSADQCFKKKKGVGHRGMREECRRLIRSGITDTKTLKQRVSKWAKYNTYEETTVGSLEATVSAVRREFGLTNPNIYRARRSKLRIAA